MCPANEHSMTEDYVEAGYWSTIEVPVGMICACMPAIRSLFSKMEDEKRRYAPSPIQITVQKGWSVSTLSQSSGGSYRNIVSSTGQ